MDCTIQFNRKKLGKVVYQKDAIVYTQDPQTLRDYVKQIYRWDTGTWQVGRKHRMWQGMSPIDWEFKMLMSEGVFFSLLFMLLPLWMYLWRGAWWAVPIDMAVLFISSLVCAVTEGRVDAALYAPLAIILRVTDCAVFLYSFIETVVIGRKVHGWFTVKRYVEGQ
jgi:cellulose synthase/poly-beta-1,6-N-acetylglucosamine synthase-like glycosyltransferase